MRLTRYVRGSERGLLGLPHKSGGRGHPRRGGGLASTPCIDTHSQIVAGPTSALGSSVFQGRGGVTSVCARNRTPTLGRCRLGRHRRWLLAASVGASLLRVSSCPTVCFQAWAVGQSWVVVGGL